MTSVLVYAYTTRTHLMVTDEDAADFLQSQFTNELRPFTEGRCTYGLWLDVKGKVLADSYVLCEGDEQFRLISETSEADVLQEKLERHIIADDVVIEAASSLAGYALIGEDIDELLGSLDLSLPGEGGFLSSDEYLIYRGRRAQDLSVEVLCLSDAAAASLLAALEAQGVEQVSLDQLHQHRVAAGVPLIPDEIGPADLPGEGGLDRDAVSFTKGCYLGQEVVARMHNVGRPQRTLFVVEGCGAVPECPVPLLNAAAKTVGDLRSAFKFGDRWQGVALLKHRFVSVGDVLQHDDSTLKVVRRLSEEIEVDG